jgi:hypothetical protein
LLKSLKKVSISLTIKFFIMKKHIFSLAALVLAIAASSFTVKTTIDTWFTLPSGANPHDPSQYTNVGSTDPGFSTGVEVAAIKVDSGTEIYTSGQVGQPKVDLPTGAGTIHDAIDLALDVANGGANPAPISNRVELQ